MSSNPRVNRYLADKAFDHIDHALGRPARPLQESYRNYFAADAKGGLTFAFSASAYWQLDGICGEMAFFSVTQSGREALAAHLRESGQMVRVYEVVHDGHAHAVPAMSASKARYQAFLDFSDADPDLTFGQFARHAKVRLAA